jgi:hypothetical protein
MPRLLQSKRTLFITLAASALVAAAASGAYAGTAAPASGPAGPAVYSGFHNAPINLPSSMRTILTMRVPAGSYAVFAKLTLWDGQNISDDLSCELVAGADIDTSDTVLTGNSAGYVDYAAEALNVVHHFASRGKIQLKCTGNGVQTQASSIRITAVKAGSLSSTALP